MRAFQVKWYHLLIALLCLVAVIFVLLWLFLDKRRLEYFDEDETDIVS